MIDAKRFHEQTKEIEIQIKWSPWVYFHLDIFPRGFYNILKLYPETEFV